MPFFYQKSWLYIWIHCRPDHGDNELGVGSMDLGGMSLSFIILSRRWIWPRAPGSSCRRWARSRWSSLSSSMYWWSSSKKRSSGSSPHGRWNVSDDHDELTGGCPSFLLFPLSLSMDRWWVEGMGESEDGEKRGGERGCPHVLHQLAPLGHCYRGSHPFPCPYLRRAHPYLLGL